jgi:hypothetical protein
VKDDFIPQLTMFMDPESGKICLKNIENYMPTFSSMKVSVCYTLFT